MTWPGARHQTQCVATVHLTPLDMREGDRAGLHAAVHVPDAVGPRSDMAGGWLAGGVGEGAGVVIGLPLVAMDVGKVGDGEPWALGRVPEAGRMATPLGDVAAPAVAVGGGEGTLCVALVHILAREVWGAMGQDPWAAGCVLGVARYLAKVGRPADMRPCSCSLFGTIL